MNTLLPGLLPFALTVATVCLVISVALLCRRKASPGSGSQAMGPTEAVGGAAGAAPGTAPGVLVLDTSTLVDGRVVDLLELGQDPRGVVVPAEVVEELEHLCGSRSPDLRRRGLLGREHLQMLAGRDGTRVESLADLPPRSEREHGLHLPGGVDAALLARCRRHSGEVLVSLDAELVRRARGEELAVLDLARLAERLSSRYRVGDVLQITVAGGGRRAGQGTATLDDGTRVMIQDASGRVGESVTVTVRSISRTRGGRVLFATPTDTCGHASEATVEEPASRAPEE